jgi:Putative peptidoglycan binding domain
MNSYQRGSLGEEVRQIQEKLTEASLYLGPLDGVFGGGTETAVRAFQRRENLPVTGSVDAATWQRLFPGQAGIPAPQVTTQSLEYRCLALTGGFETGAPPPDCFAGLAGNFDGQGLSFGVLQWNLGQGSLQPLLQDMAAQHQDILRDLVGEHHAEFQAMLTSGREEQLAWADSIQDDRHRVIEPWGGILKSLGRRLEFQEVQLKYAGERYQTALGWCDDYGLKTERAAALMFDIRVQNGSISDVVKSQILRDFSQISPDDEVARLTIIANRRAEAAKKQFIEDVRNRKLTVAKGEGKVHGMHYQLDTQYGIGLAPLQP